MHKQIKSTAKIIDEVSMSNQWGKDNYSVDSAEITG